MTMTNLQRVILDSLRFILRRFWGLERSGSTSLPSFDLILPHTFVPMCLTTELDVPSFLSDRFIRFLGYQVSFVRGGWTLVNFPNFLKRFLYFSAFFCLLLLFFSPLPYGSFV